MKKMITIISLIMIFTVLTACGSKNDGNMTSDNGQSIVVGGDIDMDMDKTTIPSQDIEQDEQKPQKDVEEIEQQPIEKPSLEIQTKPEKENNQKPVISKPKPTEPEIEDPKPEDPKKEDPEGNKPSDGNPEETDKVKVSDIWTNIEASLGEELMASMELTDNEVNTLYGIEVNDLVQYTAHMPMINVRAEEFFIAEVVEGKMSIVEEGIKKRQGDLDAQWKQYLHDQHEYVINYKLVVSGNYVFFGISENVDIALSTFNTAVNK